MAFREKSLKERAHQDQQKPGPETEGIKARDKIVQEEDDEGEEADDEDGDERTPFLRVRRQSGKALDSIGGKARTLSIDPLAPSSAFDETLRDRLREDAERKKVQEEDEEDERRVGPSERALQDSERLLERNWVAPPGKRIAVPVRIEPKVYFATERTFLVSIMTSLSSLSLLMVTQRWLNFAIYIGTIATTLLNFVPPGDTVGLISAGFFTFAALAAIAYSAVIFVIRAYSIRQRSAEGMYYDKYGPTVLSVILLTAILVNIILRLKEMTEDDNQ